MGELRLYAIGIDEVQAMFGASGELAERLRAQAHAALAPPEEVTPGGWRSKFGPIFRRVPGTPVIDPQAPRPEDLERILTGDYVPADRAVATWQVMEVLIKENSWGSTGLWSDGEQLESLDFALARGGVHAADGLWHLLHQRTELPLIVPDGLLVGYHSHETAHRMGDSYREAVPEIEDEQQRATVTDLVDWLARFGGWAETAATDGRPAPDLIAYWGVS